MVSAYSYTPDRDMSSTDLTPQPPDRSHHSTSHSTTSLYEHDIPSLSASLAAFGESSTHSGFSTRSPMFSSRYSVDESEPESEGPWAPPAWQKRDTGWYRKSLVSERGTGSVSRGASPQEAGAAGEGSRSTWTGERGERDLTPSHIPLPESPMKGTPRTSPEPVGFAEQLHSRLRSPEQESRGQTPAYLPQEEEIREGEGEGEEEHHGEDPPQLDGFVRFAFRAESLFRTAPIEESVLSIANTMRRTIHSKMRLFSTIVALFFAWFLFQPWDAGLVPDLANAAAIATRFEPLIYASENVIPRSRELAESSIAVWDLGESVRVTNMSASTTILSQLESLSDSLKVLSEKLTSFFTHVDGDIDSILLTMEWSRRELESIQSPSNGRLSTAVGNMHSALCKVGVLEWDGQPTAIGRVVKTIVGQTSQQRSKATLERTFNHLISTLEENISNEMERASTLFQLFETVDIQFQQLHRSVAREEDQMANEKDQFLASLWRRSMGSNLKLKKYEKNLKLLSTVRSSTFNNLIDLKEHTRLISSVQEQLDGARKKLVSPLIQSAQSNSFGLGHQFADLSKTYTFLKGLRDTQRHRVLQALWAEPKQRVQITSGQESPELESY